MIDWSKPIEAVHTDGRVLPARIDLYAVNYSSWRVVWNLGSTCFAARFKNDGYALPEYESGWTIRNVVEEPRRVRICGDSARIEALTATSNVSEQPAWRTSAEQLDRMDALVRKMAEWWAGPDIDRSGDHYAEASAILAAREPIDPRFEKVRTALRGQGDGRLTDAACSLMARDVLAALDA